MPKKLKRSLFCLKILFIIYFLLGFGLTSYGTLLIGSNEEQLLESAFVLFFGGIIMIAFSFLFYIVKKKLEQRKYWAWIAGIIISGLMSFNIFLFLGIPCLLGLASRETQGYFSKEK